MLRQLAIENVGPAAAMTLDFGSRVNVLTGDNGLGKSFLLDVAWWVITSNWPGMQAQPASHNGISATIDATFNGPGRPVNVKSTFERPTNSWPEVTSGKRSGCLAVYAQVDGGFCVWDPARADPNIGSILTQKSGPQSWDDPHVFKFRPSQVWNGLSDDSSVLCNGFIRDGAAWQLQQSDAFRQFCAVLSHLSPDAQEILVPGKPARVSLHDVRDIPTLRTGNGQEVPVIYLSAGVKRILSLAYLLVWLWQEHLRACEFLGQKPATEIVFLIDEIECHLHPRWQRVILNALLNVMTAMTGTDAVNVQLICVTHSPLILASLEPFFNEETDRLFHIYQKDREVLVEDVPWTRQGDVTNWLVSDIFGLKQARSREAERAIEAAEAFMRGDTQSLPQDLNSQELIHQELVRTLPGHDDFWPRWIVSTKQVAGAIP